MVKPTLSVLYGQTVQLYLLFPSPDASVFDEPEPCLVNIECISPSCNDNHYELLYRPTSELPNASLTVTPRLPPDYHLMATLFTLKADKTNNSFNLHKGPNIIIVPRGLNATQWGGVKGK